MGEKTIISLLLIMIFTVVACVPTNPMLKDVAVSVQAGGAVYSLDEYCNRFSRSYRSQLRSAVNSASPHKAVITCAGDE